MRMIGEWLSDWKRPIWNLLFSSATRGIIFGIQMFYGLSCSFMREERQTLIQSINLNSVLAPSSGSIIKWSKLTRWVLSQHKDLNSFRMIYFLCKSNIFAHSFKFKRELHIIIMFVMFRFSIHLYFWKQQPIQEQNRGQSVLEYT